MAFIYHVQLTANKMQIEYEAGGNKYRVTTEEDPHPDLKAAFRWLSSAFQANWTKYATITSTKFWVDLVSVKLSIDSETGEEFIIAKFDACLGTFNTSVTNDKYPLDSDPEIAVAWETVSRECHAFLFEGKRSQGDLFRSDDTGSNNKEADEQLQLPAPPLLLGMGESDGGDDDPDGAEDAEFEDLGSIDDDSNDSDEDDGIDSDPVIPIEEEQEELDYEL